jgi:hypothetical protein
MTATEGEWIQCPAESEMAVTKQSIEFLLLNNHCPRPPDIGEPISRPLTPSS